ncbi:hypothetical protein [Petropleomorpha daqingensis]|uniref:Uncharacterized protein n=1 Tax=Petropleomorpha daqingensis TaxID=2026353 RepID=A0A853CMV7_9ACTN|nr:hypothetical protein [Petropleomorpha daqingensis]NYJ08521.1 hypothetical protein [Petropleomorpha daqingensis]
MASVSDFKVLVDWCTTVENPFHGLRRTVAVEILERGGGGTADIATSVGTLEFSTRPHGFVALSGEVVHQSATSGNPRATFDLAMREDGAHVGFVGARIPAEFKEDVPISDVVGQEIGTPLFLLFSPPARDHYEVRLWPTFTPVTPLL